MTRDYRFSLSSLLFDTYTPSMETNVVLDSRTFRDFTIFDVLSRRKAWKSPVIFASIMTISAIICFIMHKVDGAVLLGSVLLVVGMGMPIVYFLTFFLNLKEEAKKQKLSGGRYVYTVNLDFSAIHVRNDKEEANYQWDKAYKAYRNYDAIYLYITSERAFIIPSDKTEQDKTWDLITKKMKNRCSVISSNRINLRTVGEKN